MIFAHTIGQVLSGAKSQTRRIAKEFDEPIYDWFKPHPFAGHYELGDIIHAVFRGGVKLYEVGQTLAVQPGRGQKAVGRIEITAIRREDVRQISEKDAIAEGFRNWAMGNNARFDFLRTWVKMHDPTFKFRFVPSRVDFEYKIGRTTEMVGWDTLQEVIQSRPADRYQAWVLEFKLVSTAP